MTITIILTVWTFISVLLWIKKFDWITDMYKYTRKHYIFILLTLPVSIITFIGLFIFDLIYPKIN
jgi:hypothetical protein